LNIPYGINTKERGFQIEVDEEIVESVYEMNVDREEIRLMVRNNKHNCITATYYLLLNKRARNPNATSTNKNNLTNETSPSKLQASPII
jgi:hypothetical protein